MAGQRFTEDEIRRMSEPGFFASAGDPLRPMDLVTPPGPSQHPPKCPRDKFFLQIVDANRIGDTLFECMGCGYDAVYRGATNTFEQRPNRPQNPGWQPPIGWEPPSTGVDPAPATPQPLQPTRAAAKRKAKRVARPRGTGGKFLPKDDTGG